MLNEADMLYYPKVYITLKKEYAGYWKLKDILQKAKSIWTACIHHADPNKAVYSSEDKGWPEAQINASVSIWARIKNII